MFYTRYISDIYYLHRIFHWYKPGIYLLYDIFSVKYQVYAGMTSKYLVVGAVEVDMAPCGQSHQNNITWPCHYCDSFQFTTFAHFTFGHVSVHYPFRQKERRKTI